MTAVCSAHPLLGDREDESCFSPPFSPSGVKLKLKLVTKSAFYLSLSRHPSSVSTLPSAFPAAMPSLRQFFTDSSVVHSEIIAKFHSRSEALTGELQLEANRLSFDPQGAKYKTCCGLFKCTPKTASFLCLLHILVLVFLAGLLSAQFAQISINEDYCQFCLVFFVVILAAFLLNFWLTILFLLTGIRNHKLLFIKIFYGFQCLFSCLLLILAILIFCTIYGPYDERRLVGEWEPILILVFAGASVLALPLEWCIAIFAYRYQKTIEDMKADEDIIALIDQRLKEMKPAGIQITSLSSPSKISLIRPADLTMITNMQAKILAVANGVKKEGNGVVQNGNAERASKNGEEPDEEEDEELPDFFGYLMTQEMVEFPSMPFEGYQGYRYIREMEHYDTMLMEKQKMDMMKMGMTEQAAEKAAEIVMEKRMEVREQREKDEDENKTYQDVVAEAKESEH